MKWTEIDTEAKAFMHIEQEADRQWNNWQRVLDRTARSGDRIITLHCEDIDTATVDILDIS
jgi:hypothetical protein